MRDFPIAHYKVLGPGQTVVAEGVSPGSAPQNDYTARLVNQLNF